MKSGYKLMLFAVAGLLAGKSFAETVHAAVAANFTTAMKELVTQFEQDSDHKVKLSFGSSGKISLRMIRPTVVSTLCPSMRTKISA